MKKGRRNVPYPPYQYQPFSSPYNYPMMDFRGYDYAIHNQYANKSVNKAHESNKEPAKQESSKIKSKVDKAAGPMLFNPPVVNDHEIKSVSSERNKQTNYPYEKEKPHLIDEPFISHKTSWDQDKSDLPKVESSVDEELVDQFIAMLEESSSIDDSSNQDRPFQAEKFFFNYDESSSIDMVSSSHQEEDILYEDSSSIQDESSSLFCESSSFEESFSNTEAIIDEESSFFDCESSSMDELVESETKQISLPVVKMPVLLSKLEIEMDIFDSFLLHLPIKEITKVEWSVCSLECQVPLPSRSLFVKGVLFADIEYVENNEYMSLQTVKMQVPISTTTNVNWLNTPELPSSYHAEYMYQEYECLSIQFHQEFAQRYAHPIQSEVKNFHIVWHNEFMSENGRLNVQGRIRLFVHLLQNQYIKLAD